LRERDHIHLQTYIGKVKAHTTIIVNDTSDTTPRIVVDNEITPDIIFDESDPNMAQNTKTSQI
jgi:hypothetical protein